MPTAHAYAPLDPSKICKTYICILLRGEKGRLGSENSSLFALMGKLKPRILEFASWFKKKHPHPQLHHHSLRKQHGLCRYNTVGIVLDSGDTKNKTESSPQPFPFSNWMDA